MDTYTIYHYIRGMLYSKELLEKQPQTKEVKKVIGQLNKQIDYYKSLLSRD